MNWTLLKAAKPAKKSSITLKLVVPEQGKAMFQIAIPTVLEGALGFSGSDIETADVHIGDEGTENAGRMWIVPNKDDGASKLKRLKFAIIVKAVPPAGLPLQPDSEDLDYTIDPSCDGFFLTLPAWARPGHGGEVAPSKIAGDKPAALEMNGNRVILGSRETKLTVSQQAIFKMLYDNFGKTVSRERLFNAVAAVRSPNDGIDDCADVNVVNTQIKRIREAIKGWPIVIAVHYGHGYELRRAVT